MGVYSAMRVSSRCHAPAQMLGIPVASATFILNTITPSLLMLPPEFAAVDLVYMTTSGGSPAFSSIPSGMVCCLHRIWPACGRPKHRTADADLQQIMSWLRVACIVTHSQRAPKAATVTPWRSPWVEPGYGAIPLRLRR